MFSERIPTVRISPDNATVLSQLGLLKDLAGSWHGKGFNLVARPFFGSPTATPPIPPANLFLELNLTHETLKFDPISSSIPNRGTFQEDIELFGLTYLQKISDATTGGALHIEPGIWVTQPPTTNPPVSPPPTGQIVARMGSIPHGNALLAGGSATPFKGPPVIGTGGGVANPAFSAFPSFNSGPIAVPAPTTPPVPPAPLIIRAAGTQESLAVAGGGFSQYNLSIPPSLTTTPPNPRTPLGNTPAVLPAAITQQLVNDPIVLLQQTIAEQVADGCQFEGTVLNIATSSPLTFFTTPPTAPPAGGPTVPITVQDFAGGPGNLPFLETNADSALVYATFWIEKVTPKDGRPFMQLQYAQFVLLNFPAVLIPSTAPPPASDQGKLNFSWPHVSVATLRKTFG
ncbi:MAG: heme-binding protein [Steroidobacteraceae bacterium]|jgi:hypothetical protein